VKIRPIKVDLQQQDWKTLLKTALPDRGQYEYDGQSLSYIQVVGRFLGSPLEEEEYFEFLYELVYESNIPIHVLNRELDKTIENEKFQAIQKIMNIHNEEKGLSINRFVAFMEGLELLPLKDQEDFYPHFRAVYTDLLRLFQERHENLLHPDFRRVVVDIIKWSWNHINKWMKGLHLANEVPKILWYGNASKSEGYFLAFLIQLGFDVVIFHPEGKDVLGELNIGEIAPVYPFPSTMPLAPFPETKPIRKSTVARKASAEMERVLHSDDSLLYRPWQFRSYYPHSITLKTTYDEIFLIMKEKAFIRPGFKAHKPMVQIPCLFAKASGITADKKEYWGRIHELAEGDLAVVFTSFPFTPLIKGNQLYHYQNALTEGKLDPEKMVRGNWWRYKQLPEGLQLGLASSVSRYVDKPSLKALEYETDEQLKLYLFTQAMDIPQEILRLMQQFDYSQEVPRVLLYNDEKSGEFSRSDAALLLLLKEFGIDVVLFNPTGQNDMELYIDPSLFDVHWLEEISFNETYQHQSSIIQKQGSKLKKLFSKFLS
jgi:hypothetical protein